MENHVLGTHNYNSFGPSAKISQSFGMFLKQNSHHMSIVHRQSHALRTLLLAMPFCSNIQQYLELGTLEQCNI